MVDVSETRLIEQITEVGNRLLLPPKSTPELLNLLDEVEFLLTKVGQAPSYLVQVALLIPMKALIADELFKHSDPNVRITIASCLNEVTRITAPIPPFEDDKMREIFELIVASFENLSCQPGRCYSKAVLILQSVARLRSCVMMLDLDCDPLVTKMFELFQKNISPKHPQAVLLAMVDIMSVMVRESDSVSLELLKALLASIKMENQSVLPVSWELGAKILEVCADKLRPFIMETVSSMGCCLEDFAPILSSICKPKPDIVSNIIDSSFLVNNEPSGILSHPDDYVQVLKATESLECVNALGTEGMISKSGRKQDSQNLDKEVTGLHQVNNEPSGTSSHPAEYVHALEAPESFECVNACRTGGTASKRRKKQNSQNLDEGATGLHQVIMGTSGNLNHPAEYVQALEAAENFECVNAWGIGRTASKRGRKLNSQIINEEATGLEREHDHQGTADDDIANINGILGKVVAFKRVKEEADGFENKQGYHPSAFGDSRKRRGRPRKNGVTGVSGDKALKKNIDVSWAPGSSGKKLLKQHELSGGSKNKVIETPHGRKNYEDDLVGCRIKVWWPLDCRYYEGTITLFDASMNRHMVNYDDGDEEILYLEKEHWEFIGDENSN